MRPDAVRAISLDLDDTLWACRPVIERAERTFYDWLRAEYPAVAAAWTPDALLEHRKRFMRARPELHHDLTALRKAWLAELHPGDTHFVETGFRVYWEARNAVRLYDGVEDTLRALRRRYRLGAMTNGNADVHHIGIGHLFDFVVTAAEVGAAKPAPDMFRAAAARAGVTLPELLHVGDDWERDVLGALRAGARAVWVSTQSEPDPSDPDVPRIPHVNDLPALLATD